MNLTGIPQDEISRLRTDLDDLAALALEPLDVLFGEAEPVCGAPRLLAALVYGKILLVQCARALHHDEATIVGAVGRKIEQPLDALEALAQRTLVNVWPGPYCGPVRRWQGQIHAIKRYEQFIRSPDLCECINDGWFS